MFRLPLQLPVNFWAIAAIIVGVVLIALVALVVVIVIMQLIHPTDPGGCPACGRRRFRAVDGELVCPTCEEARLGGRGFGYGGNEEKLRRRHARIFLKPDQPATDKPAVPSISPTPPLTPPHTTQVVYVDSGSGLDSLLMSTVIGAATNNALVGGLLGGSLVGGVLGDILRDGQLGVKPEEPPRPTTELYGHPSYSLDRKIDELQGELNKWKDEEVKGDSPAYSSPTDGTNEIIKELGNTIDRDEYRPQEAERPDPEPTPEPESSYDDSSSSCDSDSSDSSSSDD